MNNTITNTNFQLPGVTKFYRGKVRDVYTIQNELLVMVITDRISAFDVVLHEGIPYKGQVLNEIAAEFLDATQDIVPNWKIALPDPMVMVGRYCEPFKVEMVIRGYLSGHAWREYRSGRRSICGVSVPEGMKENDKLPKPIITPTTKAIVGHDEDVSREKLIAGGLVDEKDYEILEQYTLELFQRGTEIAENKGLILVDTKYEFGRANGTIFLIDEIHTPDSTRFFYNEGYEERQQRGEAQRQLSKEFVREWLMEQGFQGKEGQKIPTMEDAFVNSISSRYIELYENLTGRRFIKVGSDNLLKRVEGNIRKFLSAYYS